MCTSAERARPARGVTRPCAGRPGAQRGVTLVELIVALVIVGVVMTSVWKGWTLLSTHSADPLVARQQLAIAQSLLREIELQPLPGEATAAATPGRTGFASIADYDGLTMTGIVDAEGQAIAGLEAYTASISVVGTALEGVAASDGWWIGVSVSGPGSAPLQLALYRTRR